MPSTQTPISAAEHPASDSVRAAVDAVHSHLLSLKRPVDAEIRAFPPPIPACDAQFNHLLDRRAGLSRALVRLDAVTKLPPAEAARALAAFIESCPDIDDAAARRFGAMLA